MQHFAWNAVSLVTFGFNAIFKYYKAFYNLPFHNFRIGIPEK